MNPYLQTVQVHNIKLCLLLNNPPHVLYSHFNLIVEQINKILELIALGAGNCIARKNQERKERVSKNEKEKSVLQGFPFTKS